jgi:hypothetical protein
MSMGSSAMNTRSFGDSVSMTESPPTGVESGKSGGFDPESLAGG